MVQTKSNYQEILMLGPVETLTNQPASVSYMY